MAAKPNIVIIWGDDIGITGRQEPASFSVDKVLAKLEAGIMSA